MPGRALVTGASGGLGRRLLPALQARDWEVRALAHRSPASGGDETVTGDVADPAAMAEAVSGMDAVIHLAAVTHARRTGTYERANATGTEVLVRAAREAGVGRFVLVSTRANSLEGGAYSRSKRRAEHLVAGSGLEHVIVRLPEVYGLGGREGVDAIIDSARRGAQITIPGDGSRELAPLHADDVAEALTAAPGLAAGSCDYTLCGETVTIERFARLCIDIFDSSSRILRVPETLVRLAATAGRVAPLPVYPDQLDRLRAPKSPCTPDAARVLGVEFRPLGEGLRALAVDVGGD